MEVDILIDDFTDCLVERKTGDIVETEIRFSGILQKRVKCSRNYA